MSEESEVVEEIPATVESDNETVAENDVETTPETTEEVEEGVVTEEAQPQKPKKKGAKERINELTRERYEEQRGRTVAEAEAAELRAKVQEFEAQKFNQTLQEQGPTIDQYEDAAQWQQAYAQWFNQKQQEHANGIRQEQLKREQISNQAKEQAEVQMKLAQGQEVYPDFQMVISNPALPSLPKTNPIAFQEIINSDSTSELLYFLGKNPEEAHRISSMQDPHQTRREIYKLESKLIDPKTTQAVSSAPAPIGKIDGKPPAPKKSMEDMSMNDWMKARNKQIKRY